MIRHSRELSVAAALAVLLTLLAIFAPAFYEPQPLLSRLASAAPRLLIACGVALVMITRQIDISVGSLFGICSVGGGLAASNGAPLAVAVAVAIGLGIAGGTVNGVLVAAMRLPSIVVTLATMVTWREGLRLWRQGVFINLPDGGQWFGLPMRAGQITICCFSILVVLFLAIALRHVAAGRFLYAVGSDAEAARLAGLRPNWTTFGVFALLGGLTGLGAALHMVQSPQVDPATGRGLELEAIAAAVVGGVAVAGGRGNLWGVLVGFLLLSCIGPALTYAGIKPYWDRTTQGVIILMAVIADGLRRQKGCQ